MGYINGKIYRLGSAFLILLLFLANSLSAQESEQVKLYRLRFPFYEEKKDLPTIILTADEARPVGVRFELKGVKIIWIGEKITETKGLINTPSAVYDKSSLQVIGNEKIEYRSDAMDLDGVGFDIDQVKQLVHIRSKVKVVLKERLKHHRGQKRKLGKLSLKKSLKGLLLEEIKPEDDKDKKIKEEIKDKQWSGFDWTTGVWLILLLVFSVVSIKFLVKRSKKRVSSKKTDK